MASRYLLTAVAALVTSASAQRGGMPPGMGGPGMGGPPQPLHELLNQIFDKDKDGKATMEEIEGMVATVSGMMAGIPSEDGQPSDTAKMLESAKAGLKPMFEVLDADGSGGLTTKEWKWVSTLDKALKSGAARNLTRDVFTTIDSDSDDVASAEEIQAAADPEGEVLAKLADLVHEAFPLRKDAGELKGLLAKGLAAVGDISKGVAYVDADGDGQVDRKEAGKAFKKFKETFVKGVKKLQEMGPMLALFGGMGDSPMGGGGGPGAGRGRPRKKKEEL